MKTTLRRMILLCLTLLASIAPAPATQAVAPTTCAAEVRIFGTDFGTVVVTGNTVHYHDFQVAGTYKSGTLAGSTLTGTQEVRENLISGRATARGSYLVTSSNGTLTVRYAISIDDSGQVKGSFTARDGTGALADAKWNGKIRGQFVGYDAQGLPAYLSTFSGTCRNIS